MPVYLQKKAWQKIQAIQNDSYDDDVFVVDRIHGDQSKQDWHVKLAINRHTLLFKIDTGAQCNVLSKPMFNAVSKAPLTKSNAKLVAFGGDRIVPLGKTTLVCEHMKKLIQYNFKSWIMCLMYWD